MKQETVACPTCGSVFARADVARLREFTCGLCQHDVKVPSGPPPLPAGAWSPGGAPRLRPAQRGRIESERRPEASGPGVLAGMGIGVGLLIAQGVLSSALFGMGFGEKIAWLLPVGGVIAVVAWCAVKGRGKMAGGIVLGLVLLPALALLVILSICGAMMFNVMK